MVVVSGQADRMSSPEIRSASTWLIETINGCHDFKITGYSLNKELGVKKYIDSDIFTVGGHSWHIRFYPNGYTENDAGYVSVFLWLSSAAKNVEATNQLMFLDQSGGENHKVRKMSCQSFSNPGENWGWPKFMKHTDLETSCYLKCDCVHIRCHIGVIKSRIERHNFHSIPLPPLQIGNHLGKLLKSGEKTDVNFDVGGEIISAHKLLLAARSHVFNAQFYGPMKEQNDQCIKIEDLEAPIFKALLHFIYCDVLPEFKEYGSDLNKKSTSMFQHLLVAADRYCLDRLKMLCMAKLCDCISIGNVATTLAVADQCKAALLKSACLEFVALPGNLQAVVRSDDFKYLKECCPNVYIELLDGVGGIEKDKITIRSTIYGWVQVLISCLF